MPPEGLAAQLTFGISYSADEIAKLASCIRTHRGENDNADLGLLTEIASTLR